jgi:hypothetical protein
MQRILHTISYHSVLSWELIFDEIICEVFESIQVEDSAYIRRFLEPYFCAVVNHPSWTDLAYYCQLVIAVSTMVLSVVFAVSGT